MNNIDYNELKKVIKSSNLKFDENEFVSINNDMKNFINIIKILNNLKSNNNCLEEKIKFSKLREDLIKKEITKEELFKNIKHELYNYGIVIPKSFE